MHHVFWLTTDTVVNFGRISAAEVGRVENPFKVSVHQYAGKSTVDVFGQYVKIKFLSNGNAVNNGKLNSSNCSGYATDVVIELKSERGKPFPVNEAVLPEGNDYTVSNDGIEYRFMARLVKANEALTAGEIQGQVTVVLTTI